MTAALPPPLAAGFQHISVDEADHAGDTLDRIVAGDILGVVLRGFYGPAEIATILARLESDPQLPPAIPFAPFKDHPDPPYERGLALVSARAELDRYLADAVRQRAFLRRLFDGLPPLEDRLDRVLQTLGGGRPVSLAPGPTDGTHYTPATLRVLTEGTGIDLHVGLSFLTLPCCRHLCTLIDPQVQCSWFLTLRVAEEGGALVTYGLDWAQARSTHGDDAIVGDGQVVVTGPAAARLRRLPAVAERPAPGDLLVFDGGRWYHEVTATRGGPRWTLGGFLSWSADHRSILRWA
ncbi:MAG: hypothetical protein D6798_18395 [Deltaproteobacteria bacterium]|nr:MAG: hypothetical protein D6798_18395 [Deltaproteobacteria bacterium]